MSDRTQAARGRGWNIAPPPDPAVDAQQAEAEQAAAREKAKAHGNT